MTDPQAANGRTSEPKLLAKENVVDILWWVGGGAVAAGALASTHRLLFATIASMIVGLIATIVVIILNSIDRALWRRERREGRR